MGIYDNPVVTSAPAHPGGTVYDGETTNAHGNAPAPASGSLPLPVLVMDGTGPREVYVQTSQPADPVRPSIWVQTGLGASGADFDLKFWVSA